MRQKVSDIIRGFLEQQGVKNVFLLSGGMMMHLLDSLSKSTSIRYICNHHEQASAMAAEGYARTTGALGVCYATSGPGATNAVTGIAGAWLDSSPLLVITGQSRKTLTVRGLGLDGVRMVGNFEVDIISIVKDITKYCAFVDDPKQILYHLEKACYLATSGRPGPVLLDVPLDIQGTTVEESELVHFTPPSVPQPDISQALDALIDKLRSAQRPLILAGHGVRVSGNADLFNQVVKKLGVPAVTTQLANDLMAYDNDLYVGHIGLRGDRAGNFAVQACDLLITLGTSLHVTTTGYELDHFAPHASKITVDVDPAQLQRNPIGASLLIQADVGEFLRGLECRLNSKSVQPRSIEDEWSAKCRQWKNRFQIINEPHVFKGDEINTYRLVDALSNCLEGNEIVVTDAGSLYYIVGQAFKKKGNQRVIVSGAFGSMGYALPASIGSAVANPTVPTFCITGDGSMQTNVQELATVAYNKLNCKIIVINNSGYASIRNTQVAFCDGHLAGSSNNSGVGLPDWKKIADAYGVPYVTESRQSKLPELFRSLLATDGPVLCEIVEPEYVHMLPAVTSEKLPNGSFKSNHLHEMSPQLTKEQLESAGVILP